MICDADSFPISDKFTYNEIRNVKNCNVIVIMNNNAAYSGLTKKPKYVYNELSDK